jgi:hypothetical protein
MPSTIELVRAPCGEACHAGREWAVREYRLSGGDGSSSGLAAGLN